MSTYIDAFESARSSLRRAHILHPRKALLVGFLSLRFTSGTAANLSMSYDLDPASPGWNYLEIFSLFDFYDDISGYDGLVAPIQKTSIDKYNVRHCIDLQ